MWNILQICIFSFYCWTILWPKVIMFFIFYSHPIELNARMKACTRSTEHGASKRGAFWYNRVDPFHQFSFESSILCEWSEYTFFWYSRLLRWLIRPTQKYDFWIMYQSHWGVWISVFLIDSQIQPSDSLI